MLKNYLKIAWRNLWKNKGYSMLNIFGLAVGITCAAFILLWVEDELSFDDTFVNQDQIYYVPTNQLYDGEWRTFFQATPGPLAQAMKEEIPEIVKSSRSKGADVLFKIGDRSINKYGRYADPDFLEIFSLDFVEGNIASALARPDGIVISQQTAEHLFGNAASALDRPVRVNNDTDYTVMGVFKNLPSNVSYPFDWVAQFESYAMDKPWMKEYGSFFSDTFVELAPEADFKAVDAKVRKIIPAKTGEDGAIAFLHPMKDWYLRSNFEDGQKVGGQIVYVRLFTLIAIIILLIACVNFMNLSTARSEKRASEVGVRKVLGSGKSALISQFMAEAVLTAMLAALTSVVLLWILIPQFNVLIEKQLELQLLNTVHILALLAMTLICGLLAGWYPAFYLSSFKPVEVLKGVRSKKGSATAIRKALVVAQFSVSIILIICTIIVYQQVNHVKNRDLGYDRANLVKLPVNGDIIKNFKPLEQDMLASGIVQNIGLNNSDILSGGNNTSGLEWQGGIDTEDVLVSTRFVSPRFLETAGMEIVEGRAFNENAAADSNNILVTESFAKLMGTGSAIGKKVTTEPGFTVIGVVKDYQYDDMYGSSDPVIFFNDNSEASFLYVKIKENIGLDKALATLKRVLKKHNPAFPFEYEFVDDAFNARFKSEKLISSLSQLFALLAILISCLGLFALSAFTADQRKKEIGVRKVLGSSITGIVALLSQDFMKLVLISIAIATPLAWWLMQNWLDNYAYRIEINVVVFLLASAAAVAIALITVGFQAIKAARANPVRSLRAE